MLNAFFFMMKYAELNNYSHLFINQSKSLRGKPWLLTIFIWHKNCYYIIVTIINEVLRVEIESLDVKKNEIGMEKDNSLIEFQETLKKAVNILNYPPQVYEFLKKPMRFLEVSIPVRMDNGKTEIFQGYRAQHNDASGPTKGGIRFHPDVTPEEVKALAGWKQGLLWYRLQSL